MRQVKMASIGYFRMGALLALFSLLLLGACDRSALSGSKLTLDNYNLITTGMS